MVVGDGVEAVESQQLRFLAIDLAHDLDGNALVGPAAAYYASIHVSVLKGELNNAGIYLVVSCIHLFTPGKRICYPVLKRGSEVLWGIGSIIAAPGAGGKQGKDGPR